MDNSMAVVSRQLAASRCREAPKYVERRPEWKGWRRTGSPRALDAAILLSSYVKALGELVRTGRYPEVFLLHKNDINEDS